MTKVIECSGDPRQQGASQGTQCRGEIQARLREAGLRAGRLPLANLRPLATGPVLGRGVGREVIRHYTHLAERMAGLARSSRAPLDSLMQLFLRETARGAQGGELTAEALIASGSSGPLYRALRGRVGERSPWIVRHSRPDVGFSSVEVTLPWLATSVAGVNEAGVSAAFTPRAQWPSAHAGAGPAPSPILLVQECLQRFDSLEGCLDWCTKRPVEGAASLVIADASGDLATLEVSGSHRSVRRDESGPTVEGEPASARTELSEAIARSGTLSVDQLLASAFDSGEALAVELVAEKRCLRLHAGGEGGIETSEHAVGA